MKQFLRKGLAVAMALTMVFAMSTSSFADTDGSVNVQIQMQGETYIDENVTAADIQSNLGTQNHLYNVAADQTTDLNAADAIIQAWYAFFGADSYDNTQISYGWDTSSEPNGLYFITYDGISADTGNYYLVGTSVNDEGQTVYEYYWEGNSWTLYIDGQMADNYASSYKLDEVSDITFDYNTVRTEIFETTTAISGALPAPVR